MFINSKIQNLIKSTSNKLILKIIYFQNLSRKLKYKYNEKLNQYPFQD